MSKRTLRLALALAVGLTLPTVASTIGPASASEVSGSAALGPVGLAARSASQPPGTNAGPPYTFTTELMGQVPVPSFGLKDKVWISRTDLGYRLWSGQQSSHLTITVVGSYLRFRDTRTQELTHLSSQCTKQRVNVGVSALCRIPSGISASHPLLIEVWPRLGNDYTDSSTLPAPFSVVMLGDEGNDTAKFGAGRDFFNGHLGRDRIYGSGGNDWVRGGGGNDYINAGAGDDDVVGMEGGDKVIGGLGNDRIWTGVGDDDVIGGLGSDLLVCGTGLDASTVDSGDQVSRTCESSLRVAARR